MIPGRCETASVSIGIRISVADLVAQIDKSTHRLIRKMLASTSCVENDNDCFNETFLEVADELEENCPEHWKDFAAHVKEMLATRGDVRHFKSGARPERTLEYGCLLDRHLLVPVAQICSTDRWGYGREGLNAASAPLGRLDVPSVLADINQKYAGLTGYEVVYVVTQNAF